MRASLTGRVTAPPADCGYDGCVKKLDTDEQVIEDHAEGCKEAD